PLPISDMPALYRFLDAATSTLTTGTQLGSIPTLAGLAYSLRGINLDHIVFETMPFEYAGNRVRPTDEAEELWAALRADEPIQGARTASGEEPTEGTTDAPTDEPPTAEPPTAPATEPTRASSGP